MPSHNQQKEYVANAYYHIYNRGVGKMTIFHEGRDYHTFLHYLRIIFSPLDALQKELEQLQSESGNVSRQPRQPAGLQQKIKRMQRAVRQAERLELWKNVELLSFCLMPNHFHLIVYQKVKNGIEMLTRRLGSGYSGYYTRKYDWPGPIVQGRYNASGLFWEPELQVLAAARYAERNPLDLAKHRDDGLDGKRSHPAHEYQYSSLKYYNQKLVENKQPPIWLNTERLTKIFEEIKKKPNSSLEDVVANHKNYVDFVMSPIDFCSEDVRLAHLEGLFGS